MIAQRATQQLLQPYFLNEYVFSSVAVTVLFQAHCAPSSCRLFSEHKATRVCFQFFYIDRLVFCKSKRRAYISFTSVCSLTSTDTFGKMEWTEENCLHLIDLYRNAAVLWNPSDPNYYKKHLKADAWREVGKAMNLTDEMCKNKMITLLSSFRREKAKVKKSQGTGKGKFFIFYVHGKNDFVEVAKNLAGYKFEK